MKNPIVMIFLTLLAGAVVFYFILSSAKGLTSFGGSGETPTPEVTGNPAESPTPTQMSETGASGFGSLDR